MMTERVYIPTGAPNHPPLDSGPWRDASPGWQAGARR